MVRQTGWKTSHKERELPNAAATARTLRRHFAKKPGLLTWASRVTKDRLKTWHLCLQCVSASLPLGPTPWLSTVMVITRNLSDLCYPLLGVKGQRPARDLNLQLLWCPGRPEPPPPQMTALINEGESAPGQCSLLSTIYTLEG